MNQWPAQDRESLTAFYGKHQLTDEGEPTEKWQSENLRTIIFPYPMRLSWDTGTTVLKSRCHAKVHDSLSRVLLQIWKHYGTLPAVQEAGMDLFGGIYNFRRIRGGSSLSLHSWGAAIDLDPDNNPLGRIWEPNKRMMPKVVVDIFGDEGWTWGGRWNRPDAQHFQATK